MKKKQIEYKLSKDKLFIFKKMFYKNIRQKKLITSSEFFYKTTTPSASQT